MTRSTKTIFRQVEWTPAHGLLVVLAILTSLIHIYIGAISGESHFYIIAGGLVAGLVIFWTVYWDPVLYLVGVIYVTALLIIWLLDGMRLLALGVIDGAVQVALVATFLYLFFEEYPP